MSYLLEPMAKTEVQRLLANLNVEQREYVEDAMKRVDEQLLQIL